MTQLTENEFLAVKFLKVSTEELESVCKEIDVDCFPTFRVCKDGEMTASHIREDQLFEDELTKLSSDFGED
ncbi:putative thioredoxin [Phytophthora cinnamomi]|uniref:putative thioredoxin n=1 Tax=Phytophthora cinnamomi TaxID=4785 RepID=UPI00355A658D|nr:putative thioredoxin [Phytophthora cinnamomi]